MSTHRPNPSEHQKGGEPPDPTERLTQLKIELDQHTSRIDHLTKQRDDLQTDINDLGQTVTEVKATLTDYGSQIKDLETSLHGLRYFYDQKHKMVMAAIGDKKGPIDEIIREFDYETERLQERLSELNEMLAGAKQESQKATAHQEARQSEYDYVKGYKQRITDHIADLNNLQTSITQADNSSDIASMYFEVLEFHDVLEGTHLISQHQLAMELRQKLGELEQSKEHARSKTAELNRLQTEQTAHQSTLTTRIAGRRQTLLTSIQTMFPAPSKTAPAATATSTPSGTAAAPATTSAASPSTPQK
jgi:chromosome segregation ATPase